MSGATSPTALPCTTSCLPLFNGFFRTQGVILIKAALRWLDLPAGPVRPPLVDATADRSGAAAAGLRGCGSGPERPF